jgi:hypothetical protein
MKQRPALCLARAATTQARMSTRTITITSGMVLFLTILWRNLTILSPKPIRTGSGAGFIAM